jgi:hypothetical protein
MSVDLIGLHPQTGEATMPKLPHNATTQQFGEHMTMMNDFVRSLPGSYFTLPENDWRLLSTLLNQINVIKHLEIGDMIKGIEDGDQCEELSKHLSRHINFLEAYNYDRIYMKTGNWYTFDNEPISNDKLIEALNTLTPTFFVVLPKIGNDVVEYHPECSLTLDDLRRFHSFLESCGGFITNLK